MTNSTKKRTFAFPPEDRSRYYDFVDTPVNWRPSSPLIERQKLTPVEEVQLRYACKLLCEMIERGEISPGSPPPNESNQEKKTVPEQVDQEPSLRVSLEPAKAHSQPVSEETNDDGVVENRLYDSGIIIEGAESPDSPKVAKPTTETDGSKPAAPEDVSEDIPQSSTEVGIAQFYPGESGDLVASVPKASFASDSDQSIVPYDAPHTANGANMTGSCSIPVTRNYEPTGHWYNIEGKHEEDDVYFTKGMIVGSDSETPGMDSADGVQSTTDAGMDALMPHHADPVMDSPEESPPMRTPSFSRPCAVSRAASRRARRSRDRDVPPPLPHPNQVSERPQAYERRSQQSLETREGDVAGEDEFGVEVRGQQSWHKSGGSGGVAVIIGTDGMEHVMTASEEKQRYIDLQRAVMEKMVTGTIRAAPEISISSGSVGEYYSAEHARSKLSPLPKSHVRGHSGDGYLTSRLRNANETVGGENQTRPAILNSGHEKKPSLIRKLSMLSLGKRKSSDTAKNANIMGFSRVVQAS